MTALESIDDDLDGYGIPAVKMSDVMEARQYGVKTFPSIIVFVKRIPELYEGDATDEAAVLGWALVQAGIKEVEEDEESMVEEVMEDLDEMLTFPGASAEAGPPPTPKVEPKVNPKKSSPPSPAAPSSSSNKSEDAEAEEINEIVDSIKNDNNVVVFFCKYSIDLRLCRVAPSLLKVLKLVLTIFVKIPTQAVTQSELLT